MKILPHCITLLFLALFSGTAYAQLPIAWTSIPAIAIAGETYSLIWGGGSSSSNVIITLRRGDPGGLATVGVLYNGAPTPPSFQWTVARIHEADDNYALQLTQDDETNFSGQFAIRAQDTASTASSSTTPSISTTSAVASSIFSSPSTIGASISPSVSDPSASSSPTSTASTPTAFPDSPDRGLGAGAIAGIVIGSTGALALIVIAVLLYLRWQHGKLNRPTGNPSPDHHGELSAGHKANRHELFGRQKQVGERSEKDGREVRIKSGNVQELPGKAE